MYALCQRVARSIACAIVAATLISAAGVSRVVAQHAPILTTAQFILDPNQLLQLFPNGGTQMVSLIQGFVIDNAQAFDLVVQLLPKANSLQKIAIAQALAQSAKLIVVTDQARAIAIQQKIVAINDPIVNVAFAEALGDVELGGVGAGPLGGAGAGIGGQTDQLAGNSGIGGIAEPIDGSSYPTPMFTITSSVAAGRSPPGSNHSTNSPASPVSPATPQ